MPNTLVIPLQMILILIIAWVLAPIYRVFNTTTGTNNDTIDDPIHLTDQHLHKMLIPLGRMRATNQGQYFVWGYSAKKCAGSIALLNLQRNAEAAHILSILVPKAQHQGYIFNAKIYPKFPQFAYALARVKHKFSALIGRYMPPITALAFAEFGQCQLAPLIANNTE